MYINDLVGDLLKAKQFESDTSNHFICLQCKHLSK